MTSTEDSTRPWGGVEEQAWKDLIDTVVVGTDTGAKNTSGHSHWIMKDSSSHNDQIRVHEDYVIVPSLAVGYVPEYVITDRTGKLQPSGHGIIDEWTELN